MIGLGLDLSSKRSGAAWMGDDAPRCSSFGCGGSVAGSGGGRAYGAALTRHRRWLLDLVELVAPDRVGFEAPIMIPGRSADTALFLIQIAGVTEQLFYELGIPCYALKPNQVRKQFLGDGAADYLAVQAQCRRLGWRFANDDESDALAVLWCVMATDPKWRPPLAMASAGRPR
jgi:Holliday junction resolvasome RuvABC endonuclease subunit